MTLIKPYSASFYVGDNETKEFPFTFDEVSESFVKVLVSHADGSVSIPTYTVDLQLKQVVFGDETPAPTDDDVVCIYRATPVIQDTPFRTLQGYNAQALENILSKIVAMIQEIKSTYFSTQILQGEAWQLDLLKSEDNGATVNIDYVAKKLVKGLYFQIKDGNLQVSADGNSYITMPKSVDVAEFRQREVTLPDLTVVYKLEYRVGNIWYDAGGTAESKADEAIQIAEEARDIANEAKDIAEDAKETAEGIDGKAQEALDKSSEAVDKVEELEEKIIVKSDTIPTASADLVGSVYQYIGATNGSYTHGYIYECKAIPADTLVFSPDTVSCSWTDLSAFLQTETADYNSVVAGTMTYFADAELWRLVFTDANGDTVLTYQQYTADWEDVGFAFNDIFHDGDVVSFARYTVATHIWERIDVQPNHNEDIAELHDEISNLKGLGRFLSVWNCATGLAETNPPQSPYTYHTGDYFLVGTVGTTNYRPDGATYTTGVASTTVESNVVKINDAYIYDGTNWKLQQNSQREYTFSGIVGSPYDNTNLSNALNGLQGQITTNKGTMDSHIGNTNNPHSVTKAQVGLGNVDNTSDLNKPISTATQTALNGKQATISDLATIRSNAQAGKTASDTIATYGDIVTHNVSEFATAAQGAKADTALQTGDNVSELVNDAGYLVMSDLANFVTKNTAQTISGLKTFSADITLSGTTSIKNTTNGVSYTMLYRDASGIHVGTSTQALLLAGSNARPKFNNNDIAMLSDVPTAVSQLTNDTGFITNAVNDLQNYTLTSNLATVATTGDYDDLLNKPTIPTVNDATLTIQKNGTSVATFTANASSNVTANISVPTTTNDLTNNSGFITSSDIPVTDVTVGGTSVVSSGVAAVPAIPTVNNATITITQGGVTKGSFTLNQATGDTIALDAGGGSDSSYHPDLFDVKWADHICNDVQWLRADTFSWQSGAVYQVAYQHLADDIDGKTLQSETVAGTTIQFYLADDGHKICPASEESNVSAIYNATGVAWYYIIDTANTRFKLPRINSDKELSNISAPVITNSTEIDTSGLTTLKFKKTDNSNPGAGGVGITSDNDFISTNQSLGTNKGSLVPSNLIANLSNATGLYKGKKYLYFYVGNFTQAALENTAGLNAELFNQKADLDLSNAVLTSTFAQLLLNAGIDVVVEKQLPTAENNYTWYRKYKSGWVEQGGKATVTGNAFNTTITMPVEMANTNYTIVAGKWVGDTGSVGFNIEPYTTTTFRAGVAYSGQLTRDFTWQVSGMAA